MNELHQIYLSLGSNIEPENHLPKAVQLLKEYGQVKETSSVWETKAVGSDGPNFLNACVLFLSPIKHHQLKDQVIRPIEAKLGRIRYADKNAPRTIDIDLLLFDQTPLNTEFWDVAFVAVPLAELIPDFEHPIRQEKLIRVAEQLQGQMWIVKREDIAIF
ncbi:MAG: 2-amino-4-hydroxy-6-hydroxymethyldihydropteridine diphosphokinase [Anaerolineales bacterium]|nr:2-amino-4-hydroxy-6-hydroxymethyldihydropteridine diphosphokinase [Anaerolineales bacterium]